MIKCETCHYYNFYKMITKGAYSYAGFIPCLQCKTYLEPKDYYEPIGILEPTIKLTKKE